MKRNIPIALGGLFLTALLSAGPLPPLQNAADDQHCISVSGTIAANLTAATEAQGTVTGDLGGSVTASFTATPQNDGSIALALQHIFVTERGDSLTTDDTGLLVPVPGAQGVFRMTVQYTVTGGTGKFAGATGTLRNHGEAVLSSNPPQLTLRYSGQICVPSSD
jgi:hypothetical protein